MAKVACQPCNCIDGNQPVDTYRQNQLIILCDLLAASIPVEGVFDDAVISGAAAGIPQAGVSVYANTDPLKAVSIGNRTDVPVRISFDGGANYSEFFAVNENRTVNLAGMGIYADAAIFARAVGADSTSGNLYIGVTK